MVRIEIRLSSADDEPLASLISDPQPASTGAVATLLWVFVGCVEFASGTNPEAHALRCAGVAVGFAGAEATPGDGVAGGWEVCGVAEAGDGGREAVVVGPWGQGGKDPNYAGAVDDISLAEREVPGPDWWCEIGFDIDARRVGTLLDDGG